MGEVFLSAVKSKRNAFQICVHFVCWLTWRAHVFQAVPEGARCSQSVHSMVRSHSWLLRYRPDVWPTQLNWFVGGFWLFAYGSCRGDAQPASSQLHDES